jgi:4-amino-4-deoxy-L-arabinose transferase-like glycosyltransferase
VTPGVDRAEAQTETRTEAQTETQKSTEAPAVSSSVSRASTALLLSAALLLGWFWFRGLGRTPIENGDEAIYAVFVRNMLRGRGWIWLTWGSGQTYQRPPLAVWLAAACAAPFGPDHLSARLLRIAPCAAGLAALWLTYATAARAYGSRLAGLFAALLCGGGATFYHFTHRLFSDAPLLLALTGALYASVRGQDDRRDRWPMLAAACLGLAVAVKSIAGLLPAPVVVAAFWIRPGGRPSWKALGKSSTAFVGLAIPWYVAGVARGGVDFLREHFGFNLWARARGTIVGVGQVGPTAYLHQLWSTDGLGGKMLIVSALGVIVWCLASPAARARHGRRIALALAWAGWVLVVVTAFRTRLPQYLLPAYPGAAVAAAASVAFLQERVPRAARPAALGVVAAALLGFFFLPGAFDDARFGVKPAPEAQALGDLARQVVPPAAPLYVAHEYPMALAFYADRDVVLVEPTVGAAQAMDAIDLFHDANAVRYAPDDQLSLVCDEQHATGRAWLVAPTSIAIQVAARAPTATVGTDGTFVLEALACRAL